MKMTEIKKLTEGYDISTMPEGRKDLPDLLRSLGMDPGSLYQELEMESRFADTHRDVSWDITNVNLHSHNFYEMLYCCNTCGAEYLVGSERYRLQQGDVIIVPPGISHRPLLPETMAAPYERYVVWISQEFLKIMEQQFPDERFYQPTGIRLLRTAGTKWEYLGDFFRRGVRETEQKKPGWEAAVAGNTLQLMVQVRRAAQEKTGVLRAEKPELLEQVMAYIEKHYPHKITLPETARHFYVSESTISQLFRSKMGVSFYRCVTQRRLIEAKRLIGKGLRLEQVGEQVGFSDYSSFYRAFRQEYGISPRQYRKLEEPKGARPL